MKTGFSIGVLSETGRKKSTNQDKVLVKLGEDETGEFGLFVVADGMGGYASGEIASSIAVEIFKTWWHVKLPGLLSKISGGDIKVLEDELHQTMELANSKIIDYSRTAGCKMGTTLSVLFIYRDRYIIKHIGDSRIYLINNRIIQLTEDHSLIAQMIKKGVISAEQVNLHPGRNILTQCAGMVKDINIFGVSGQIDTSGIFLVCSDGFYDLLSDAEVFRALHACKHWDAKDIQNIVEALVESAREKGEDDDVSVIAVCCNYGQSDKHMGALVRIKAFLGIR